MPRLSQSLPKYRKHRASGQAIVELNGHRHYLGPHGTKASKVEYDRLIAEWLAGGRRPLGGNAEDALSIAELILAYWQFVKRHYVKGGKPTSEQSSIRWALKPLRETYGKTPAVEFGALSLKALRGKYVQEQHSRLTVNQNVGRIVRMFKWAAAEELIPASVPQALTMVDGLRRGRSEAKEGEGVEPVSDEVVEATLPHLPEVVADMVRLQRSTGMRPGEVCAMRPCDIDRSGKVWLYRPEQHKTQHHGKQRIVPLGPKAQAVLLRYLARDSSAHCFRPCDSEAKRRALANANRKTPLSYGNTVGTNRRSKPKWKAGDLYDTNAYRRAIHRACDKAFPHPELSIVKRRGLTDDQLEELKSWQSSQRWAPNQLRHTAGTEVRREFGLEAAQTVLGHSKADVTEIYAERDLDKALQVAALIG